MGDAWTELPLDRPHPAVRDGRTFAVRLDIAARTTIRLTELAEESGGELHDALVAGLAILLHRYGDLDEGEVAVGLGGGNAVVVAVTSRTRFDELLRSVAGSPRSMVAQANVGARWCDGASPGEWPAGVDVGLDLWPSGDAVAGRLIVASDVLDAATAKQIVGHLLRILDAVASEPAIAVDEIDLLTPEERAIVAKLNADVAEPLEHTLDQCVTAHADAMPDAVAVRGVDETLTYRELDRRSNQVAHLLQEAGVGRGDAVGICMDRSPRALVAIIGVLKIGAAYVPIAPDDPSARREQILSDAGARVVLADADVASAVKRMPSDPVVVQDRRPTDAAYLLYTSGSTGQPKGVIVEHRQLAAYVVGICQRLGIDGPLRYALVQPFTVDSSVTAFALPLWTGGEVHVLPKDVTLDAPAFAAWVQRWGVDVLKIAPSHLRALQASPAFDDLRPRRFLVIGGEASDWQWLRALQLERPDCVVVNHYGPTETTVGVTTLSVGAHLDAAWATAPIGVPLPNAKAFVVDRRGREVPFGVAGELVIAGDTVARGYQSPPEGLSANAYGVDEHGRTYRTGDRARRLPDGTIAYLGRTDDQVKVRGHRVSLGEIDAAIIADPAVRAAVTVLQPIPTTTQQQLVAYLEVADESLDTASLRQHLRERLSPHMVPQAIHVLSELPRTAHGKIDRSSLARRVDAAPVARPFVGVGGDDLEQIVASVWADLLGLEAVRSDANFFDVGGHSLLLVELQSALRERTGQEVELLDLFENPTVTDQVALVRAGGPLAPAAPSEPVQRIQAAALSKRRALQLRSRRAARD